MKLILLEGIYILAGLIALVTGYYAFIDKEHKSRIESATFWGILGMIFIVGKYLPPVLVGGLLIIMGILSAMKKVVPGSLKKYSEEHRMKQAKLLENKLFLPALAIGITAFAVAQFIPSLGGLVGLGFGALLATIMALVITKDEPKKFGVHGSRLLQQIGPVAILPQLLTALGALFNKAGLGEYISQMIGGVITEGNLLVGIIAYCVGMAVFTMIMGNAFAAFAVITAGIGIPFVYSFGGNPAMIGIMALTAGYCGTLMTPMAANFNIVPAAILETKNKYRVIISQLPVAFALLVTHIFLMYYVAF